MSAGVDLASDPAAVLARLRGAPLVLMLDVDGTLAPIAPRPEDATVPAATREVIAALARRADTRVALVSGRAAGDALRIVDTPGVWAAGNHGFELVAPDGTRRPHPAATPYLEALAAAVAALRAALAGVAGAIIEDKGPTISVHYRLVEPSAADGVRATARQVAHDHGLRTTDGKLVVELRPPVAVDKGTAVATLAEELGGGVATASLLFAGDDVTDEDGFRRLRAGYPGAVTILVGDRAGSAAEFRVEDPDALRALLAALLAARSAADGG